MSSIRCNDRFNNKNSPNSSLEACTQQQRSKPDKYLIKLGMYDLFSRSGGDALKPRPGDKPISILAEHGTNAAAATQGRKSSSQPNRLHLNKEVASK